MAQTKKAPTTQRVITIEYTVVFENGDPMTDQQFVDQSRIKIDNKNVSVTSRGLPDPQ